MKKRILSILIVLTLLVTFIPAGVYAADETETQAANVASVNGTEFTNLNDAIVYAQAQGDNTTVKMIADDTELSVLVPESANKVVLDLNGFTLSEGDVSALPFPSSATDFMGVVKRMSFILVQGRLAVNDSSTVQTGKICGFKYTTEASDGLPPNTIICCIGNSSIELYGGEIVSGYTSKYYTGSCIVALDSILGTPSVNIAGGKLTATASVPLSEICSAGGYSSGAGVSISSYNAKAGIHLTVTGGIFNCAFYGIYNGSANGVVDISGGTINAGQCAVSSCAGTVNITGGVLSAAETPIKAHNSLHNDFEIHPIGVKTELDGTTNISGDSTYISGYYAVANGTSGTDKAHTHTVNVKGGSYKWSKAAFIAADDCSVTLPDNVTLSSIPDSNGYYKITPLPESDSVASVGKFKFSKLTDAINYASLSGDGSTVVLIKDCTAGQVTIPVSATPVVLDLNGHTLAQTDPAAQTETEAVKDLGLSAFIDVLGKLVIEDSAGGGLVSGYRGAQSTLYTIKCENGSSFELKSGTVKNGYGSEISGTVLAASATGSDSVQMTISGGKIVEEGPAEKNCKLWAAVSTACDFCIFSMTGGEIDSCGIGVTLDAGSAAFSGGTINAVTGGIELNGDKARLTVSGGNVTAAETAQTVVTGSPDSESQLELYTAGIGVRNGASLTVSGGSISGCFAVSDGYNNRIVPAGTDTAVNTVIISGGRFKGTKDPFNVDAGQKISISGRRAISTNTDEEGYVSLYDLPAPDAVATVGDKRFGSLNDAIVYAQTQEDNTVVKLIWDTDLANVVVPSSDRTVILDLNGYNISQTCPVAPVYPAQTDPDFNTKAVLMYEESRGFLVIRGKLAVEDSSGGSGSISGYAGQVENFGGLVTILCIGGSSLDVRGGSIIAPIINGYSQQAIGVSNLDELQTQPEIYDSPASITVSGGSVSSGTTDEPITNDGGGMSGVAIITYTDGAYTGTRPNTVTITGGTVTGSMYGILALSNTAIEVTGGTVSGAVGIGAVYQGEEKDPPITLSVSGGAVTGRFCGIHAVGMSAAIRSTVDISGGIICSTGRKIVNDIISPTNTCGVIAFTGAQVNISGTAKISGQQEAVGNGIIVVANGENSPQPAEINISGGLFRGGTDGIICSVEGAKTTYADGMALSELPDSDGWYACRNKINVSWVKPDGTFVTGAYPYMHTPSDSDYTALGGVTDKVSTDGCTYTFSGWSPAYGPVASDVIYNPVFNVSYSETAVSGNADNTIDATSDVSGVITGSVTLDNTAVKAVANGESLTVKTDAADVTFNEAALDDISSNSGTSGVTLVTKQLDAADVSKLDQQQQNAVADATAVIDLNLVKTNTDGSTEKVTFNSGSDNGAVKVSIPYTPTEGTVPKVYFVDDSGNATLMDTTYADGMLSFTTTHFSVYCVKELSVCTVSFAAGANGTLSGTASLTVDPGHVLTAAEIPAVSPAEKYKFAGWQVNGNPTDPIGTAVNSDVTYTAVFTRDYYEITNESGISGLPEKVNAGEDLSFTPAAEGGLVTGVSVSICETTQKLAANADGSYTLKSAAITDDVVVSADIIKGAAIKFVTRADCLALKTGTQIVLLNTTKLSGSKYVLSDGTALYWSKVFNAYFAVVGADKTAASVSAGLTTADGDAVQVFLRDVDLNGDGRKNIVDSCIMLYIKGYMAAQEIIKIVNSAE